MRVLGFLLATSWIPEWTGWVINPGWAILTIVLVIGLRERAFHPYPLLIYACLSMAWVPIPVQGIYGLWMLWIWCMIFTLAKEVVYDEGLFTGMAAGLCVSTVVAVAQYFGLHPVVTAYNTPDAIGSFGSSTGLFYNSNVYGEICALTSLGLIGYRRWPWLVATLPGVLLSNSRGATLALGAALVPSCWQRLGAARTLTLSVILAAAFAWGTYFGYKPIISEHRLAIWSDTLNGISWWGHGPESFIIEFPKFSERVNTLIERPIDPHDEFLRFAFEYGLASLVLAPLVLASICGPLGPWRLVAIGFMVLCFFGYPLRVPAEALLGIFCVGRCYWLWRIRFDSWLRRGSIARLRAGAWRSEHVGTGGEGVSV